MGYKQKPNKGMSKRMKVTGTGKVKHRHELNSHLRSGRSAKKKRHLGRPAILAEGHARNMRRRMLVHKLKPAKAAHEARLAAGKSESAA
jgi:large subunit ribosomal protein L35